MQPPQPFPKDEIVNDQLRIAKGWAHVEMRDRRGNLIKADDVMKLMPLLMLKGGIVTYFHTNRKVAQIVNYGEATYPGLATPGVWIQYVVDSIYDSDSTVWDGVKSGALGLSWAGHFLDNEKVTDRITDKEANLLNIDEAYEIALAPVEKIINPLSLNIMANTVANADVANSEKCPKCGGVVSPENGTCFNCGYVTRADAKKAAPGKEPDWQYDPVELDKGVKHEAEEHHLAESEATKTAKEHLAEIPDYYTRLEKMEAEAKKEGVAKRGDIKNPFAGYSDFNACVAANKDKDDPKAYCATIMRNVEGASDSAAKVLKGNNPKGDEEDDDMEPQPNTPAPAATPQKPKSVEERVKDLEDHKSVVDAFMAKAGSVQRSTEDHAPNKIESVAGSPADPAKVGAQDKTDKPAGDGPSVAPKTVADAGAIKNAVLDALKEAGVTKAGFVANASTPAPVSSERPANAAAPKERPLSKSEQLLKASREGKALPTYSQLAEEQKEAQEAPMRAAMGRGAN